MEKHVLHEIFDQAKYILKGQKKTVRAPRMQSDFCMTVEDAEKWKEEKKCMKHICTITRKLVSEEYIVMATLLFTSLNSILCDCQNACTETQKTREEKL